MLLLFIVAILALTVYGICTNKMTVKERNEMLNSEDMFP